MRCLLSCFPNLHLFSLAVRNRTEPEFSDIHSIVTDIESRENLGANNEAYILSTIHACLSTKMIAVLIG
jgi:hypothetical protein